jgi:threonine dehydrogenase-like Zn-dependent dehydrogenase
MITDDSDAIIRITSTGICGSDLHMYFGEVKLMMKGDILGHEPMGIVDKIGPNVHNVKVGDRVVVAASMSCGQCEFCQKEQFSLCDNLNPSSAQEYMYGHRLTGLFGYSHQTGGFAGGQAEYLRVPFADNNLLVIKNQSLKDDQVLFLSDIVCTGYHGTELAQVQPNSNVVVFGCGPVGLLATMCSLKLKKAARVISIDSNPDRLALAQRMGAEPFKFDDYSSVTDEIAKRMPGGPDHIIECVGLRFPKTWTSKIQRAIGLETDSCDILKEAIIAVKKGGKIGIIGDYFGNTNGFPIGTMMEKGLTLSGGQLFAQKYWKFLLEQIEKGVIDPSIVVTEHMPLEEAAQAYHKFAYQKDGCIKIVLQTKFNPSRIGVTTSSTSTTTSTRV